MKPRTRGLRLPSPATTVVAALWPTWPQPAVIKRLAHWYRTQLIPQGLVPTTSDSKICQPPLLPFRTRP
jgi:hypothetical protein